MDKKQKNEIEAILGEIECPKDFRCYTSGFEYLCKAQDVGTGSFLRCMEEDREGCKFLSTVGNAYFCDCPLRKHIIKKLKK